LKVKLEAHINPISTPLVTVDHVVRVKKHKTELSPHLRKSPPTAGSDSSHPPRLKKCPSPTAFIVSAELGL
jgi:hypothetical protein